jgi:hypothetical protein
MVNPETNAVTLDITLNTRLLRFPLIDKFVGPGPTMVRLWLMASSPLVNTIIPVALGLKTMVSPEPELMMAWRKEPDRLSLVFMTVKVAATTICGGSKRTTATLSSKVLATQEAALAGRMIYALSPSVTEDSMGRMVLSV